MIQLVTVQEKDHSSNLAVIKNIKMAVLWCSSLNNRTIKVRPDKEIIRVTQLEKNIAPLKLKIVKLCYPKEVLQTKKITLTKVLSFLALLKSFKKNQPEKINSNLKTIGKSV